MSCKITLKPDSGSFLLAAIVYLPIALIFSAIVIDIAKAQYHLSLLQNAVDAASLAGASELVNSDQGNLDRWINAKMAAIAVLRDNFRLRNYQFPNLENSEHPGIEDFCDSKNTSYRHSIYDDGKVRIEIERGVFVYNEAGNLVFESKESDTECFANGDPANPTHPVPNAVRVSVSIYNFGAVLARIAGFGFSGFSTLSRESTAA